MHLVSLHSSNSHEIDITFFFISFFFWSFAAMTYFAFFLISLKLFDRDRTRLREYFLLFSSFNLRCRHICNFVFWTRVLKIISETSFFIRSLNCWASTESLHCVFFAILRSQWCCKVCLIWATSSSRFSWRNKDNVNSWLADL